MRGIQVCGTWVGENRPTITSIARSGKQAIEIGIANASGQRSRLKTTPSQSPAKNADNSAFAQLQALTVTLNTALSIP